MFFSGKAFVYVWFDDEIGRYRIEVEVKNKFWGPLFGFSGTFDIEWEQVDPSHIPRGIMPKRDEPRI
jgi:hypothetical protein